MYIGCTHRHACKCARNMLLQPQSSAHAQSQQHLDALMEAHMSTLQHTATHCNTLQHTATHFITLQHTATHYSTLQHTATH